MSNENQHNGMGAAVNALADMALKAAVVPQPTGLTSSDMLTEEPEIIQPIVEDTALPEAPIVDIMAVDIPVIPSVEERLNATTNFTWSDIENTRPDLSLQSVSETHGTQDGLAELKEVDKATIAETAKEDATQTEQLNVDLNAFVDRVEGRGDLASIQMIDETPFIPVVETSVGLNANDGISEEEIPEVPAVAELPETPSEETNDSSDEPSSEPVKPMFLVHLGNDHVTQTARCYVPTPEDNKLEPGVIPSLDSRENLRVVDATEWDATELDDQWVETAQRSTGMSFKNEGLLKVTEREGSDWSQSLDYKGRPIGPAIPKFKADFGMKLTGVKARSHMRGMLGMGSNIRIPCVHSGLQLVIESPQEGELLMLERAISASKTEYGVSTHGLVYTSSQGYLDSSVGNFLLDSTIESNLVGSDKEDLLDLILLTDLPHMSINTAASMYTSGYPYEIPCTANPGRCSHIAKQTILLHKLNWYDKTKFTEEQKEFIANIAVDRTREEILAYQMSFETPAGNTLSLKDGNVVVHFSVPSLRKHFENTQTYMAELSLLADQAVGIRDDDTFEENEQLIRAEYGDPAELTEEQAAEMTRRLRVHAIRYRKRIEDRTAFINQKLSISSLREYAAWVTKVVTKPNDNVIDDPKDIRDFLSMLSTNNAIVSQFIDAVNVFIENATHSLVATPAFVCPECQKLNTNQDKHALHPHLIPLNAAYTFFTLGVLRITQAQQGEN